MSVPQTKSKKPFQRIENETVKMGDVIGQQMATSFNRENITTIDSATKFIKFVVKSPFEQIFWDGNKEVLNQMMNVGERKLEDIVPVFYVFLEKSEDYTGHFIWTSSAVNYFLRSFLKEEKKELYAMVQEEVGVWLCAIKTTNIERFFRFQ